MSREDSLEGDLPEPVVDDAEEEEEAYRLSAKQRAEQDAQDLDDQLNLPPGRMHATRVKERLSGSGQFTIPPNLVKRRPDYPPSPRSRSRSPSLGRGDKATATTDGNSSMSSLEDYVDSDILLDRAGIVDTVEEGSRGHHKSHNSREFINLPPVNERLSEDTLEDCHAFSDVVRSSNASRANSIGTGNEYLEPLNECDDEEDDLDDIPEDEAETLQVILTNLDNLNLHDDDPRRGTRGTGGSSLMEEAPSAPTA